MTTKIQQRMNL